MHRLTRFLALGVVGFVLAGCRERGAGPSASLQAGSPAPEIQGEDLDGKSLKLSDFRGKVVLLDFWASS